MIIAAEDRGPLLHARIGMMRALITASPRQNGNAGEEFNIIR